MRSRQQIFKSFLKLGGLIAPTLGIIAISCSDDSLSTNVRDFSLKSSDFLVVNSEAGGLTIKLDATKVVPSTLEIRYFVGLLAPSDSRLFQSQIPPSLRDGDKVWVRVFDKGNDQPTNGDPILVLAEIASNLILLNDEINSNQFVFSGDVQNALLTFSNQNDLSPEAEVRYFVGTNAPSNESSYSATKPNVLHNGDRVWMKLFVKNEFSSTHRVAQEVISKKVEGLRKLTLNQTIENSYFSVSGEAGRGSIFLNKEHQSTLANFVLKYSRSLSPTEPSEFAFGTSPTDLRNGDELWIKLFLKPEQMQNYNLTTIAIKKTITGLNRVQISDTISELDFTILGLATEASLLFTKPLNSVLELKYFVGMTSPQDGSGYSLIEPKTLKNTDRVWIKLSLKQNELENYTFTEKVISKDIKDVSKFIIPDKLIRNNFTTLGDNGFGTLRLNLTSYNPNLEIRYAVSASQPLATTYSLTSPEKLKNLDKVWIRFFVKDQFQDNFQSDETPLTFTIENLRPRSVVADQLLLSDFSVTPLGSVNNLEFKRTLPEYLEARYYVGEPSNITGDSNYSTTIPTALASSAKIVVKLFVKESFSAFYTLSNVVRIGLNVSGTTLSALTLT